MGAPKAMLDAGGRTFVTRLVESLAEGGCDPVVVVGASRDGPLAEEVAAGSARLLGRISAESPPDRFARLAKL